MYLGCQAFPLLWNDHLGPAMHVEAEAFLGVSQCCIYHRFHQSFEITRSLCVCVCQHEGVRFWCTNAIIINCYYSRAQIMGYPLWRWAANICVVFVTCLSPPSVSKQGSGVSLICKLQPHPGIIIITCWGSVPRVGRKGPRPVRG